MEETFSLVSLIRLQTDLVLHFGYVISNIMHMRCTKYVQNGSDTATIRYDSPAKNHIFIADFPLTIWKRTML